MPYISPVLTVKSVYEPVPWYRRLLGFEPSHLNEEAGVADSLNYAVLRSGPVSLHLGRESDMGLHAGHGGFQLNTERFEAIYENALNERADFYIAQRGPKPPR